MIVYRDPRNGEYTSVRSSWGGLWWSESFPVLPDPPIELL